jgi:hypothetical protein
VVEKHQYVALLTNATYELAAWVLIVAGCLVFLVTVIGCIGVLQENRFFILVVSPVGLSDHENFSLLAVMYFFFNFPLYLQSVPVRVHSANVVKSCTKACRRVLRQAFIASCIYFVRYLRPSTIDE